MPSLKDKYSDAELDRSNRAFDEIVARPDMKALDDQGDAVARDLKKAERSSSAATGTSGSLENEDAAREAETQPSDTGFYQQQDKKEVSTGSGWSRRRKLTTIGAGGGIVGALIAGMMALLPMKIIGVMDMIVDETGQRVEQVTEKRAKLILGRAILTKFGSHTGIVLTGDGAFKTLVASMRTSGFEKRLAAKGLVIEQTPDGVKLKQNGKALGGGKSLKNEKEIIDALEKGRVSNQVLKQVIKEDIPSWRWMKRAKFAKWLRIKYNIPRYGILNNSKESDDTKRAQEIQKGRLSTMYSRTVTNALAAFDCLLGSECVAKNLGESTKGDLPNSDKLGEATNDIKAAGDVLTSESTKNPFKIVSTKITTVIIDKLGTKAIPIIGWIDLVATLDHIAWEALDNDYFSKIPAYFRGLQYAQIFGEWSGYSDQQKLGALDHAMNGPLANQLDGAETSQAFSYISGDASKGKPIELKVDSNNPSKYKEFWDDYKNATSGIPGTPGGVNTHDILNVYYETIGGGGALGWLGNAIGGIMSKFAGFLTPDSVEQWLGKVVEKSLYKVMDYFGLTIDPLDAGPDLFNNIHAGGTVSFNDYCHEIGCRKLSPDQANLSNQTIANEKALDTKERGLMYALFSPENTTSLTTKLAIATPTPDTANVGEAFNNLASLVKNVPSTLASIVVPKTNANTKYVDLYGVDPYGATTDDLNQPLSEAFVEGDDCPDVGEGEYDSCRVDSRVADAMVCEFTPDVTECSDTVAPTSSEYAGGASFRISSFNIYYSSNDSSPEYSIRMWKERLARSSKVIKENNFDVVGLQEVRENQWQLIQDSKMLGDQYDIYPKEYAAGGYGSQNPIVWDRNVFDLVEGKPIPGYQVKGPKNADANMQVKLRYKETGQEIYVINHHEPVGNDTIQERYNSAKDRAAYVKALSSEKIPIFLTGDFNSSYTPNNRQKTLNDDRNNMAYCIFSEDSLMWDAYDAANNKPGHCPSPDAHGVDHIFMSTDVQATKYDYSISPRGNGSDVHNTLFADVVVPGAAAGVSLNVATFNIFHSTDKEWRDRLKRSVDVLTENNVDVAGLQEVRPDQNKLFRDPAYGGNTYDMYPKALKNPDYSPNPIIWNKSKYRLLSTGNVPFQYFGGMNDKAPLVKLQDIATGQKFIFINTHDPADARGEAAQYRHANALRYAEILKDMSKEGLPIFFTGDFNSGYTVRFGGNDTYEHKRENLTYCILTDNTGLWDGHDAASNKTGKCPTTDYNPPGGVPSPGIDHIFLSQNVMISDYKLSPAGKKLNGSDGHPTVIMTAVIAGEGGAAPGGVGAWHWPLGLSAFKQHRSSFLGDHDEGGGFLGNGNSSVDISWGDSDTGAPIYSMLDGVVKTRPLSRSSTACVGTPNGNNNGGMMIESNVNGKIVQIAYAHGSDPRFDIGDTVKSGQQILRLGNVGNSCGSHLHMNMTYGDKNICLQDVFLALEKKQAPNLDQLTTKATSTCGGRL